MKKLHRFLYIVTVALAVSVIAMFVAACSGNNDETPPAEYTLTFISSDGTVYDTYTGVAGSDVVRKPDPEDDAIYRFEGWSTSADGEVVEVPTVMPDYDQRYYAIFARYYNITVNAGDGTLADSQKVLSAKADQNLYSLVKDIVPTAPGVSEFDGWYYNNTKLTADSAAVMPAKNISVEAKYSVGYTINVYVQKEFDNEDSYEEDADKRIVGKSLVGTSPRANEYPDMEGYEINEEKCDISEFVLASTANTFNVYYSKNGYNIMFVSNSPEEDLTVSGDAINDRWGYREVNQMPECPYSIKGYRFSYWSADAEGTTKYYPGNDYNIYSTTMIYAIWVQGYSDASGLSPDWVYIDKTEQGKTVAYLNRTYQDELVGEYDGINKIFIFKDEEEKVVLSGKLYPDSHRFVYSIDKEYVLRENGLASDTFANKIDTGVTLRLSNRDTAVYNDGTDQINGTYAYNEQQHALEFTSKNKSFYFRLTQTISADTGLVVDAFEIRSAEYGVWRKMNSLEEVDYSYNLILDGYGTAQMLAVGYDSAFKNRITTTTTGIYRYTVDSTDDKPEIAVSFNGMVFYCMLVEGEEGEYGTDQNPVSKVYVEKSFISTVYAKPADGTLNTEDADKIVLDGYGLFDDSATLISGGTEIKGKYNYDSKTRQLQFMPTGANKSTYELSNFAIDQETNVVVYEGIDQTVYGDYTIFGLESSGLTPGTFYALHVYNNGKAEMKLIMPFQNTIYNFYYLDFMTVVTGTIKEIEDGEYENEYKFDGQFAQNADAYSILLTYYMSFGVMLDISSFDNYKFYLNAAGNGVVTGVGDDYGDITITYDGVEYKTDGYGNAVVEENPKLNKTYTGGANGGLRYLQLRWTEYDDKNNAVNKSQLYLEVDGKFLKVDKSYKAYNTSYITPMLYVLDGNLDGKQYAALGYSNNDAVTFYATGAIDWENSENPKYGKFTVDAFTNPDALMIAMRFGERFKFGISTIKVSNSTVNVFYMYDSNTVTSDGLCTIAGEHGEQLIIDRVNYKATYKVPNAAAEGGYDSVESTFTYRDGIITIAKTEDETTTALSFLLIYSEEDQTVIESFRKIGDFAGYWQSTSGGTYMYLTGQPYNDQSSEYIGYYIGSFNEEGKPIYTYGTYVRTDNEKRTEFKFTERNAEDESAVAEFYFIIGYSTSNSAPVFNRRSDQQFDWYVYNSFKNAENNIYTGEIATDGYSAPTYSSRSGSSLTGQVIECPNESELYADYDIYAFVTTSNGTTSIAFFFIVKDDKAYMLDSTFRISNYGLFTCDETEITIPETEDSEEKTITVTSILFDGMGNAELTAKDGKKYTVMYGMHDSNTFRLIVKNKDGQYVWFVLLRLAVYSNTDEETGVVTYRSVATFRDTQVSAHFDGPELSALRTDGFSVANYVDGTGRLYAGAYMRLEDHPEVIAFVYTDGINRVVYFEIDTENKTFKVLGKDDPRISAPVQGGEDEGGDGNEGNDDGGGSEQP